MPVYQGYEKRMFQTQSDKNCIILTNQMEKFREQFIILICNGTKMCCDHERAVCWNKN